MNSTPFSVQVPLMLHSRSYYAHPYSTRRHPSYRSWRQALRAKKPNHRRA